MEVYEKNPEEAKEILFSLLWAGANINQSNLDSLSPIHIAAKRGNCGAVQAILEIMEDPMLPISGRVLLDKEGGNEL